MRNLRVPGHVLVSQGWGHHIDEEGLLEPNPEREGMGRALCRCGEYSPPLPSRAKRQKWLREIHKPEVLGNPI